MPATTGTSANYQAITQRFFDKKVLPVAQKTLVLRQFSQKIKVPKMMGQTYTGTRFDRFPLPYGPLSEGTPPVGRFPTISQVMGVVTQWGDRANLTDISDITPLIDVLNQAGRLLELQVPETYERNLFSQIVGGATQRNFVNSRGSRALVQAGDLLDPATVIRTVANLETLGAYKFNGPQGEHDRITLDTGVRMVKKGDGGEHFSAIVHPLVSADFKSNSTVQLAWSYSAVDRLWQNEVGQWSDLRFCKSNMVPYWVGVANNDSGITYTPGAAGSLATNANTYIQITGSDPQNQYEQRIYQISGAQNVVAGPNGSVSVQLPTAPANYTFSIYICQGANTTPQNLGACAAGPTSGPYAGMAVQLVAGTVAVITGIGTFQVPPAAPQTGVTVFPTMVIGENFFAALELEGIQWFRLMSADKSDPINQLRIIGWKGWDGAVILNQQFGAIIESSAASTGAWT